MRVACMIHLLFIAAASASAEVTPDDIARSLRNDLVHPYLYFTESEKPALLDRINRDPESADLMARFLAEANRLLHTPVEMDAPPQEPHPGFTNSDARLAYLRANLSRAHILAFVYQMTGDARYARKSFEFADAVCDLPTWVDRRHQFPIIYSRVWPWNVPDDQASFGVDLETTDTARMLAAVYDWLYPALEKRERDRIRGAILEKAILRVRGNWDYHWWASSYRCNWCGCLCAGLGTASLALMTEDPRLVDVIAESVNRIGRTLDEIDPDGGWAEGCGYYRKTVHALNFFADPLKRLSGGKYNLYDHPRLKANPISFLLANTVTPRRLLVFEDSGASRAGASHIWNKLAVETGNAQTAWFRNFMFGAGSDPFDLIWPRAAISPALPAEPSRHFRGIGQVVMRSGWGDPDRVVLACTAGANDDPHHGHLDAGHFVVYWRDQEFIRDIGSPEYDELYFDEARWTYPQASSAGHNVVLVNGELQIPAKLKDKPWRDGIRGKVVEFRSGPARDYTLIDPTAAHEGHELKKWRRHLVLDKPNTVIVLDEVTAAKGAEIEARFHSECTVSHGNGFALLKGAKGAMALIPLTDAPWRFREGRHADLPVMRTASFRWIPYSGVVRAAGEGTTRMATLILPVADEKDASAVARSAKMSEKDNGLVISFESGGTRHEYRFRGGEDGMVLEK